MLFQFGFGLMKMAKPRFYLKPSNLLYSVMSTLLVKNALVLATMNANQLEIPKAGLFARDGIIEQVGPTSTLPNTADTVLDLEDHVVLPGLINTHHHFYQTLTRGVIGAQNANLFTWLKTLYPIWARLTPEALRVSTQIALAELARSGCTTASDHHYIFPNGCTLDDQILAAREVGLRLHASRGSMSLGESQGGLPPDHVVEKEDFILADSQRLIEKYHDPKPGAMTQVVLAPCSPFSVTPDLMRQSARLARTYGVMLHTHLAETKDEEDFCLQTFGKRPVALMEDLEWLGQDVWFAHAVHVSDAEIQRFASCGCGAAHCPSSNMRLASGIAPLRKFLTAGVKIGLGVDGSASNDGSSLLLEARQAMLLSRLELAEQQRRNEPFEAMQLSAREALAVATIGGAKVLNRPDLGSLEVGKRADFFAVNLNRLEFAGAWHDPVAAMVFCATPRVDLTVVEGRIIVQNGELVTLETETLISQHNRLAKALVNG
jgi:8-oxoguanine deaminase